MNVRIVNRSGLGVVSKLCISLAALAAGTLLLGGCHSESIRGRVVQGQAGVIAAVSDDDSRKDQPGVAGAQIEIRTKDANAASRLVGKATTDASGEFSLPISESIMRRDRLQLSARNEGYLPLRSDFYLSDREKLVLVVMKNIGAASASAAPGATPVATPTAPSVSANVDDRKRE